MTTEKTAEKAGAETAEPFGDTESVMDARQMASFIATGIEGVKVGATGLVTYDEAAEAAGKDRPPLIEKDLLEKQAFVVLNVTTRVGGAIIPDTGEVCDLVMVAAQPVQLDARQQITKAGKVVIFTAGNNYSVLGQEMQDIEGLAKPESPILIATGLQRKSARQGDYHTVRGRVSAETPGFSLFD